MSKEIDEKVVQMQFDNKNFESNVKTSISTLDKLKQSLRLDGVSKGLENVDSAAKKIDFSKVENTACQAGFHIQDVWLKVSNVLEYQIAGKIVDIGKKLVNAFAIEPVTTGFQEYELKMGSVQTIMASTGATLQEVNQYLAELNKYSDQTIYSFSDMTNNIGKFTNAGVKLEDAVLAIKGVSNEAAVSGANANEASRAMYNFAQALSAGYVKLIDWKSIENANMATVEFKNQLIQSAVACGTLTKTADGMYDTGKHVIDATHEFNDSLADQWMTTEVLVNTLKAYADENTEIGAKAYAAAMDVKTFSMMMDTLKEAAQSGWAETWELIIGDFEQAKEMFTYLSKIFGNAIDAISNARNTFLRSALTSKWSQLTAKINEAGVSTEDFEEKLRETFREHGMSLDKEIEKYGSLENVMKRLAGAKSFVIETLQKFTGAAKTTSEVTGEVTTKLEELQKVVNQVIKGDFGNGTERVNKLTEAGYKYATVQGLVNKVWEKNGHTWNDTTITAEDLAGVIGELSAEELQSIGYTEEQANALKELAEQAAETGTPLNELINQINKPSGRDLIFYTIQNVLGSISNILGAIRSAWSETFDMSKGSGVLYDVIEAVYNFSEKLKVTNDDAEQLKSVFKGVFALLSMVAKIAGGALTIGFEVLKSVLAAFDMDVLDLAAKIGDAIVKFRDWVKENNFLGKAIAKVIPYIVNAVKAVASFVKENENLQKSWNSIKTFFSESKKAIASWIEGFENAEDIPTYIIEGLVNGLTAGVSKIWEAAKGIGKAVLDALCKVLGIHSPSKETYDIGRYIVFGLFNGIRSAISTLINFIKNIGTQIIDSFKLINIQEPIDEVEGTVSNFVTKIKEIFGEITVDKLFTAGISIVMLTLSKKLIDIVDRLTSPLEAVSDLMDNLGKGIKKVSNSLSFDLKMRGLKSLAIALGIMVGVIAGLVLLGKVATKEEIDNAIYVLVMLSSILTVMGYVFSKLSEDSVELSKEGANIKSTGAQLVSIGLSLLLMAAAVKMVGKMDPDALGRGFDSLVGMVGCLMLLIVTIGEAVKGKNAKYVKDFGKMISKISWSLLLLVGVIKLLSLLKAEDVYNACIFAGSFILFVETMALCTKLMGKKSGDIGSMMLKMSAAMLITVGVIKMIGAIDFGNIWPNLLIFFGGFTLFVIAIAAIAKELGGDNVLKIGGLMLKLSAAMLIMVGITTLVGLLKWPAILKGLAFMAGFTAIVAGIAAISKYLSGDSIEHFGKLMLSLAGAIAILAAVTIILSVLNPKYLWNGIGFVAALTLFMMGLIMATGDAKSCVGNLIVMTVAITLLASILVLLSFIKPERLVAPTIAMGALMLIFAAMLRIAKDVKSALPGLIVMTTALAIMGAALFFLAGQPWGSILAAAAALSIVMIALAATLTLISTVSLQSLLGVAAMAILSVSLIAIAFALKMLADVPWPQLLIGAGAISLLVLALAAASAIIAPFSVGALLLVAVILSIGVSMVLCGAGMVIFAAGLHLAAAALPPLSEGIIQLGLALASFIMSVAGCKDGVVDFASVLGTLGLSILIFLAEMALGMVAVGGAAVVLAAGAVILGTALLVAGAGLVVAAVGIGVLALAIVALCAAFGWGITYVSDAIFNVTERASEAGKNLVEGFSNGINGAISKIVEACSGFVSAIGNTICGLLGIHSPSVVAAMWGLFTGQGFANGLTESEPEVEKSAGGLLGKIKSIFTGDNTLTETLNTEGEEAGVSLTEGLKDGVDAESFTSMLNGGSFDLSSFKTMLNGEGEESGSIFSTGLTEGVDTNTFTSMLNGGSFDLSSFKSMLGTEGEESGSIFSTGLTDGVDTNSFSSLLSGDSFDLSSFKSMLGTEGTEAGTELTSGLTEGITLGSSSVNESTEQNIEGMLTTIENNNPKFKEAGSKTMTSFREGIEVKKSSIVSGMSTVVSEAVNSVKTYYDNFKSAGKSLVEGFAQGISNNSSTASTAARNMAQAAYNAAKKELEVNSPSKKFRRMASCVPEGFAQGIDKMSGLVESSAIDMAKTAIDSTKDALSRLSNVVDDSVEVQPTVRPVVDMSEISTENLRLTSNIDAMVSQPVNSWSQRLVSAQSEINNSNNKVIEAIKGLRSDFASLMDTDNQEIALYVDSNKLTSALVNPMNRQLNMVSRREGGL